MKFTTLQQGSRQKGLALLLAIGFLAILSILGAVVLDVATRDLTESAASKPRQQALYAADRTVEYAMNRDIILNLPVNGSINLADEAANTSDDILMTNGIAVTNFTHKMLIDRAGPGTLLDGTVTDIGPRALPAHLAAIHGSEFGANLYHVNVKAKAGAGRNQQTTHVDASIVRLFKMDDDQIFRTSGGG